jgi:hypothetical protein
VIAVQQIVIVAFLRLAGVPVSTLPRPWRRPFSVVDRLVTPGDRRIEILPDARQTRQMPVSTAKTPPEFQRHNQTGTPTTSSGNAPDGSGTKSVALKLPPPNADCPLNCYGQ